MGLSRLLQRLHLLPTPQVVPVVRLAGVLSTGQTPLRSGLSLQRVAPSLKKAFSLPGARAVALVINSPGGSPVQSSLIAKRIRQLSREKNLPVIAFVEDVAASGGYWLAAAADEIVVDASSIIGSIGVISGGFGFTEMIKKLGIERRVHAIGDKKGMLDPFRPEKAEEVEHLKALQGEIHRRFIAWVKERRGLKLKGSDAELFSGAFWTGESALRLGLADALGDLRGVLRERFGAKVRLVPIERRRSFLSGLLGRRAQQDGDGIGEIGAGLLAAVEERFLWNRFGL
ncbi:MAG TPA: S49 family peptidase [Kiloniellales bacterium]|nr:S49 family peptidase [Kiloniellales bacterium]